MKTVRISDLEKFVSFVCRMPEEMEYLCTYSIKNGDNKIKNLRHLFKDVKTGEKILFFKNVDKSFSSLGIVGILYESYLDFQSNDLIINKSNKNKKYYKLSNDFNLFIETLNQIFDEKCKLNF